MDTKAEKFGTCVCGLLRKDHPDAAQAPGSRKSSAEIIQEKTSISQSEPRKSTRETVAVNCAVGRVSATSPSAPSLAVEERPKQDAAAVAANTAEQPHNHDVDTAIRHTKVASEVTSSFAVLDSNGPNPPVECQILAKHDIDSRSLSRAICIRRSKTSWMI